jgi:hypothetical protein
MSDHAANPAGQPNSSLEAPNAASASCRERNGECSTTLFDSTPRRAAVWANFRRLEAEDDFAASGSLPPRIPSSTRDRASGLYAALRQARSSASASPALRVTVSIYDGPSVNAELRPWEAGPLAWLRLV